MSLYFAIIPEFEDLITIANEIQSKLIAISNVDINVVIDKNYSTLLTSRINKWKKQSNDIITIDEYYNETHTINVIFCDKGSRGKNMEIDEFIDLVESFSENNAPPTDDGLYEKSSGCRIM
jgi:hypothetical protein